MKSFFITFFSVCLFASSVHAAQLSFGVQQSIQAGSVVVDVLVDTAGESINSADVTIRFPSELLTFGGYGDGAIPLWIERPHVQAPGVLQFSGVIPGGVDRGYDPEHPQSRTTTLVRLYFGVRAAGSGELSVSESQLLKNDGHGTSVPVTSVPFVMTTNGTIGQVAADTISPQPFRIIVMQRSLFGKTPRLATFAAIDAQTGIDHYEARIGRGTWYRTTSPAVLPFRLFSYTFAVRAYDFSGNFEEQSVDIPGVRPDRVIIGALLIMCIFGFMIYKKKATLSI